MIVCWPLTAFAGNFIRTNNEKHVWNIGKLSTWQVVLECESSFRLCIQESPYFLFQVEGDEAFLQLLEHFPTAALLTLNVWKLCAKHHIFKYWNENQVDKISSFALEIFAKFLQANPVCFDELQLVSLSLLGHLSIIDHIKSEKSQLQGTFWGNCSAQVFGSRTKCNAHNSFRKVSFCNQRTNFRAFTWEL